MENYRVLTNGLIEQWGTVTTAEVNSTVDVPIAYNSKDTYWVTSAPTTQVMSDDTTYYNLIKIITNSQFLIKWYSSVSGGIPRNKQWKTIGY